MGWTVFPHFCAATASLLWTSFKFNGIATSLALYFIYTVNHFYWIWCIYQLVSKPSLQAFLVIESAIAIAYWHDKAISFFFASKTMRKAGSILIALFEEGAIDREDTVAGGLGRLCFLVIILRRVFPRHWVLLLFNFICCLGWLSKWMRVAFKLYKHKIQKHLTNIFFSWEKVLFYIFSNQAKMIDI